MNALTIIATLTLLLAFLAFVATRLGARRREMSAYAQRWHSQGSVLVFLGGAGWLLCLIIFAARLRGSPGVGLSELMLVGVPTLLLLGLAAVALLVVWCLDRFKRRGTAPPREP